MEYSKTGIIEQLKTQTSALANWYTSQPAEALQNGPEGAWTAGQHLLHMIKSAKPLAVGAGYPRLLLRLKFGKVKEPSLGYEELVKKYTDALSTGGQATGVYVPREVKNEERDVLVKRFKSEMNTLINNVSKWSEKNLDKTAVPHPLIGKLTFREMLYFTIYHTEHHRKILEERY
ncbi:MAG: DinB family protein [Flavobacteriales bacterium]